MSIMLDHTIEQHRRVLLNQTQGVGDLDLAAWRDTSQEGRLRIISGVGEWLRRERQNGLKNAWTYSLPRHRAVHEAWVVEKKLWEEGARS
jgi:hypothetical protein